MPSQPSPSRAQAINMELRFILLLTRLCGNVVERTDLCATLKQADGRASSGRSWQQWLGAGSHAAGHGSCRLCRCGGLLCIHRVLCSHMNALAEREWSVQSVLAETLVASAAVQASPDSRTGLAGWLQSCKDRLHAAEDVHPCLYKWQTYDLIIVLLGIGISGTANDFHRGNFIQ